MTVPTPVVDPEALAAAAAHVRLFALDPSGHRPLYHRLASAAANDPEVLARLWLARPEQRRIMLLLAAVHDVLLAGNRDPLGAWYSSITDPPHPVGHGADDPWPHFRRLALEDDGVAERLATRSTQTNEVGRCALLLPALAQIAAEAGPAGEPRPLGLVDVGASAGLNLLLDRYEYRYEPGGIVGGPSSLVLPCRVRGTTPPPLPAAPPPIASRVGLDLHPIDIADRDAARWLVACQWPDQPERVHRVRAALALAHGAKPRVVQGDAVDGVAALVEQVPARALPVVSSTWAMAYLPDERQAAFIDVLDRLGAGRDLSFVYADQPDEVPGFPVPPHPDGRDDPRFTALVRTDWRGGARRDPVRLADCHPHGTWIEWLAAHPTIS